MSVIAINKESLYVTFHFGTYSNRQISKMTGDIKIYLNEFIENSYNLTKNGNTWYLTMDIAHKEFVQTFNTPNLKLYLLTNISKIRTLGKWKHPIHKLLNKEYYGLLLELNRVYKINSETTFWTSPISQKDPFVLTLKHNPKANTQISYSFS